MDRNDGIRRRLGTGAWLLAGTIALATASRAGETPEPELNLLKRHVTTLAGPEYQGRRGIGGQKAASYIIEAFRQTGLEPLFDGRYTQDITGPEPQRIYGRNVGARLEGSDPVLKHEWIVLAAHYDHLGVRKGVVFPGADDNASGVAMMLEVARGLSQATERPRRSIMFLGFDLEEDGLWGSRFFVDHPPVPLNQIVLNLTADMIGRSLGGVCDPYVFVLGSESAPGLRPWIDAATPSQDWKVGVLGADLLALPRSDYGPFKARKIPYLFFSTGENPCYHAPDDTPDTIDYPKLHAISRMIARIMQQATQAETMPKWVDVPEHASGEPGTLREILEILLAHRERLAIGSPQILLIRSTMKTLEESIANGGLTAEERPRILRAAQIILLSVL